MINHKITKIINQAIPRNQKPSKANLLKLANLSLKLWNSIGNEPIDLSRIKVRWFNTRNDPNNDGKFFGETTTTEDGDIIITLNDRPCQRNTTIVLDTERYFGGFFTKRLKT